MGSSFRSEEEVREYLNDYTPDTKKFMEAALNAGGKFLRGCGLVIIVEKPELKELNDSDVIGLYLSITRDSIWAYVAVDRDGTISDWLNLGDYSTSDGFDNVVARALKAAGTCNYCHNFVGYKDIHRVCFAGKSCTKCLPAARAKDEQPGWYN